MNDAGVDPAQGARPSPGCMLDTPAPPVVEREVRYKFPDAHDPTTPLPLMVVFHATNTNEAFPSLSNDANAQKVLIAAPREFNAPSGFETLQTPEFTELLDAWLDSLCVDEARLYAVGNGSGGRFLMKWLQAGETRFRSAAVVGTFFGVRRWTPLPLLFVHGTESANSAGVNGDGDGTKALGELLQGNECGDTAIPVDVPGCMSGDTLVDPGCMDYEGCSAPFRFCHHDDPTQSQSGDRWACFATDEIYRHFETHGGLAASAR